MNRLIKAIKKPKLVVLYLMQFYPFRLLSDELYLKIKFKLATGKKLNLDSPKSFNEKLQWLKIYDRNPKYTKLVDKYEVRKHIIDEIGEEYLIPLYGVWNNFEEINFEELPNQFVLKPNHTSGDYFICKDKSKIEFSELEIEVNNWLKREYYWVHREWPYKNVKPLILAEKYIENKDKSTLNDYKFYCFNGKVHSVMVSIDREINNPKFYFFDRDWNLLRINTQGINATESFTLPKPSNLDRMFQIASVLSENIPHVRVDLYNVDGKIYFGELTFFSESGFDNNLSQKINLEWGKLINLNLI